MIEKIKKEIEKIIPLTNSQGLFLSGFDEQNNLVLSSGVIHTDKNIATVIDMIYNGLFDIHKDISTIVGDIINNVNLETSMEAITALDLHTYGICASTIDFTKSGVVLPSTAGINNASEALLYIKQKNNLSGNISIYSFTTQRIIIK